MLTKLIVVIASTGKPVLLSTLNSLDQCIKPPEYRGTIVVENGPKNGVSEIIASAPLSLHVKYLYVPEANKAIAQNAAIADIADDTIVFFTDDDISFDQNILVNYVNAVQSCQSNTKVVFGGPVRISCSHSPPKWLRELAPPSMKGWEPKVDEVQPDRVRFLGANWAAYPEDIRKVGGFDPRFGPGSLLNATGEEMVIQNRLKRNGVQFVYVPNAVVWHHVKLERYSAKFLISRAYRMGVELGIWQATNKRRLGYKKRAKLLLHNAFNYMIHSAMQIKRPFLSNRSIQLKMQMRQANSLGQLIGYTKYIRRN